MSVSAIGASSSADISSDFQVKQLQYQINDWTNCPTTPPDEKRQIVSQLETQLQGLESALEKAADNKAAQNPSSATTGRLDVKA